MTKEPRRIKREKKTIRAMIGIYCRDTHQGSALCEDCHSLADYAVKRIDKCPFFLSKPTCLKCPSHCYKPKIKEKIREVMRYSGPRMMKKHPVLAALHIIDGFRKTPQKKTPNGKE